ncbi:MAG TPA: hypothetical protein VFR51_15450 [Pyrinomonadaceae bacterium]|nr:hypothetical protein [Pyrinomonadaceae bacterium]
MLRPLLTFALILTLPLISPATSLPKGLEFSGLAHKVVDGPDEDSDLEISVKVNVRNTTGKDRDVKIKVRAVDAEEYEVFDMPITGIVNAHETRVLTDTQFISEKVYRTIVRWEIED